MQTLTMQGIADLAQVKRAVVSVWRTRHSDPLDHPFPATISNDALLFDAEEIADWLRTTGRGNNPEAALEVALHTEAFSSITEQPDLASALLLLHALGGAAVHELTTDDAGDLVAEHQLEAILDADTIAAALNDRPLGEAVDQLAEAAFSATAVLKRLVEALAASNGVWSAEAITTEAQELFGGVLRELLGLAPRVVVPWGPGGALLTTALSERLGEADGITIAARDKEALTFPDRVVLRYLAASGASIRPHQNEPEPLREAGGTLHVLQWQSVQSDDAFSSQLETLLVSLAEADLLVVVGPARLLIDKAGRRFRAGLLAPQKSHTEPLRYVARFQRGLSRFGGQRRLALWVFGAPGLSWTTVGEHSNTDIAPSTCSAIASDVAASLAGVREVRAHAFLTSGVAETEHLARQEELVVPPHRSEPPVEGGERLARIWALRDALATESPDRNILDRFTLESRGPGRAAAISFARADGRLARDLPGVRIPNEHLGSPLSGSALVIGPQELRNPRSLGSRAIDRLLLETVAPRAQLTEPGDVVYVSEGGPAAMVDEAGGHVVLSPARVFRCLSVPSAARQLSPAIVAADIAAQQGRDRRRWQLRTVATTQAPAAAALTRATATMRRQLREELDTLDALEHELVCGLADGSLTATFPATPPSPTPKATR